MALNSNYMIAPSLQEYFVDKATGFPLAAGSVYYYADNNRTSLKAIYTLTEVTPGTYVYMAVPNPVILSAVGTTTDGAGNDIKIYYYPYDSSGNVELYFIEVYNSAGSFQWSRFAWPNLVSTSMVSDVNLQNFIANGQFLVNSPPLANAISANTTYVAPGNWIYDRTISATDTDTVGFTRFNNYTQDPSNAPRYAANIVCVSPGNATVKYFGQRFPNVNTFSSDIQQYTLGFFAVATAPFTASVVVRKFFGTGGSPSSTMISAVGSINITTSYPASPFLVTFTFGGNESDFLGTNNDDYVDLLIGLPVGSAFNFSITDVMLVLGSQSSAIFPIDTSNNYLYQSLIGSNSFTNYNNYMANGLHAIYGVNGWGPDLSEVGKIVAYLNTGPIYGYLLLNGAQYSSSGISSDLIPYSRIANILWNSTLNEYLSGMGLNYATCLVSTGSTSNIFLFSNQAGAVTVVPTDGAISTGFTFQSSFTNQSSAFAFNAAYGNGILTELYIRGTVTGAVTAVAAGTSGFTVSMIYNNASAKFIAAVTPLAASGLASEYFTFSTTVTNYYVWFKVGGTGTDPAPGGTGILVNLNSADSIQDVAAKIIGVLNGGYGSCITVLGGSSVTTGSYFSFGTTNSGKYFVWFQVGGVGTQPVVAGYTPILCNVLSGDTAAQVAVKIKAAINFVNFAVPNFEGLVLMGQDPNGLFVSDYNLRGPNFINGSSVGTALGSLGLTYNLSHLHTATTTTSTTTTLTQTQLGGQPTVAEGGGETSWEQGAGGSVLNLLYQPIYTAASTSTSATTVAANGGTQSQPFSATVNWFIKY